MSYLNYTDINTSGLILTSPLQNKISPNQNEEPQEPVREGLNVANISQLDSATYNDVRTDFGLAVPLLNKYSTTYDELKNNKKYDFQTSTDYNPLNDPSSQEYVPKIHEAALDDTLQKLDFQNRVYAYTTMGLVTVIIAGVLFNSNR